MSSRLLTSALRVASRTARMSSVVGAVRPAMVARTFSINARLHNKASQSVLTVLKSELDIEEKSLDGKLPENLASWLNDSGYTVVNKDVDGKSIAEITKKVDNEIVHVIFDISQVTNVPMENDIDYESEEDFDGKLGTSAENFSNINVVVENTVNGSALVFDLLYKLDDCTFYVESLAPYSDAKVALSQTAEDLTDRQIKYLGPSFSNLDQDLQLSLEEYLRARGIDEELGSFVTGYSEYKENNEYFQWLGGLKKFFA